MNPDQPTPTQEINTGLPTSSDVLTQGVLEDAALIHYTTTIPTYTPTKNGVRELYYDGTSYWLYIYANGGWRTTLLSGSSSSSFGTGSDGAVTLDGSTAYTSFSSLAASVYTLSRDIFCTTLTVNNGVTLKPNGFRVFANTSITIANGATVSRVGNNGADGTASSDINSIGNYSATPGTGGAGGAALASGTLFGSFAGGAGSDANYVGSLGHAAGAGTAAPNSCLSANGVAGGDGGAGSNGTTRTTGGAGGTTTQVSSLQHAVIASNPLTGAGFLQTTGSGGGGGAGGFGTHAHSDMTTGLGGGGGGAGSNGGIILLMAPVITNSGTITVRGGNGGNGARGANANSATTQGNEGGGGGGGGAPGNGGVIVFIYSTSVSTGTCTVAAGTAGTGGAYGTGSAGLTGGGNGFAGSNAGAGSSGSTITLRI